MTPNSDERRKGNFNALELLQEDHDTILAAFAELQNAQDPADCQDILSGAYDDLILNTTIKQDVFYPDLREFDALKPLVDESRDRQVRLQSQLEDLVYTDTTSEEFQLEAEEFTAALGEHYAQERSQLFTEAARCIDEAQLEELAVVLEQSKGTFIHSKSLADTGTPTVRTLQD